MPLLDLGLGEFGQLLKPLNASPSEHPAGGLSQFEGTIDIGGGASMGL